MKWFDKWFANKCQQVWENEPYINLKETRAKQRRIGEQPAKLGSSGVHFTLYNANGGTVVELNGYDEVLDRHNTSLYVISSESDIGQQLAHIIMVEALKR